MKRQIELKTEILVIGAGPAGLSAAITAARAGKKVLLVEKNGYLGGNATLGLPLLGFLPCLVFLLWSNSYTYLILYIGKLSYIIIAFTGHINNLSFFCISHA